MGTYQLLIETSEPLAHKISDCLAEGFEESAPALSTFEQSPGRWTVAAYFEQRPDEEVIRQLLAPLLGFQEHSQLSFEELPDIDWVSHSQAGLQPVYAGNFIIHGEHDRGKVPGRAHRIQIDAGQAFGTAHHGTTIGCLSALERLFRKRAFYNVLDVGTGSGILAIAAAKSNYRTDILGCDIDAVSVNVATENAHINAVGTRIDFLVSDGLSHSRIGARAPFDLIIANILAKPLNKLAPEISSAAVSRGFVVLSGLLDTQAPAIIARYRTFGLIVRQKLSIEGWATLILQKR